VNLIKLSETHYFGFLYLAFAHYTDGKYTHEEQLAVWKSVRNWTLSEISGAEFAHIMDEVMEWYKHTMTQEGFEEEIFDIARRINEYSWFDKGKKLNSLKDLKEIALADEKFIKNERNWIRTIGRIWEVDANKIKYILAV